ncbi:retrovirus-related pol polyprotein from transposon TNT 1-94 [Tanacetum coccineum]
MVISALEDYSLYSFFANSMPNKSAFSVFNNSYSLWHHRLSHVSDSTLKHIPCIPQSSKSHTNTCLSCPMAKFTKLLYATSDSHYDYSRGVWTYLLVHKSDAYSIFKSFITFVKRQFEKEVKVIRSDNALEFLKGSLGPFMSKIGIGHQTSCVDRPQQNGRVERKHKNILEIARALRFHAHLLLSYWGDYVVTATYLINRFPSVVLGNKTPYEMIMNKKPSYSNLKVFGCLAVESNPSRVTDKMAPRGVPCLFLGYPPHQKGYTLLNLLTHTRFVSRDVTFYEHIFPYSNSSMSQIPKPIPTPSSSLWYKDFKAFNTYPSITETQSQNVAEPVDSSVLPNTQDAIEYVTPEVEPFVLLNTNEAADFVKPAVDT